MQVWKKRCSNNFLPLYSQESNLIVKLRYSESQRTLVVYFKQLRYKIRHYILVIT